MLRGSSHRSSSAPESWASSCSSRTAQWRAGIRTVESAIPRTRSRQIDGCKLIDGLFEGNYDDVLSIEHEDPVWSGSDDRVKAGIEIAQTTLTSLLVR